MATMTLRGIDAAIANRLKEQAKTEGTSVNALTLRLIKEKLGIEKKKRCVLHNDLDHLAGTWTDQDVSEFKQATAEFENVDVVMWR
jgi:hypothetical protein